MNMDQSAFNALFKKSTQDAMSKPSKRQLTPENTRRQQGGSSSRFTECPICAKSVHASLANAHVERCVAESSEQKTIAPSSPLLVEGQHLGTLCQETEGSKMSGRGRQQHEGDGGRTEQPHDGVQPPASTRVGASSVASPVSQVAALKRKREMTYAAGDFEQHGKRPSGIDSGTTSNNAFSRIMAASALVDFREEMYIWRHDDDTFSWGWGPAGSPRPVPPSADSSQNRWSCRVAMKGPTGLKAGICELWTNISPVTIAEKDATAVNHGGGSTGSSGNENSASVSYCNYRWTPRGVEAAFPSTSLSRLSIPVLKSMLQKNVRRGRAEAAVRCALELALKSWNDAIRRILVIVIEDSLLHPAAPALAWLMAATSKGYRPPPCLVDVFLCAVYETAKCPVRDSTESCRTRNASNGKAINFMDDKLGSPHPRDIIAPERPEGTGNVPVADKATSGLSDGCNTQAALTTVEEKSAEKDQHRHLACGASENAVAANPDAIVACCRRALLMRMAYGGMNFDQSLLKGSVLSWGERCAHMPMAPNTQGESAIAGSRISCGRHISMSPTSPPALPCPLRGEGIDGVTPFDYMHHNATTAHKRNAWMAFVLASYAGCGMPMLLRSKLLAHTVGGGIPGIAGTGSQFAGKTRGIVVPPMESLRSTKGTSLRQDNDRISGTTETSVQTTSKTVATAGDKVLPLRRSGLGPLVRETDAILSGVDFHCSNVLEEVLRSATLRGKVAQALRLACGDSRGGSEGATTDDVRYDGFYDQGIEPAAKQAMWTCSSGLNARKLQLRFEWDKWAGPSCRANAVLVRVESDVSPSLCVDTTVWAALSSDVAAWARRFVRGKLAPGALGRSPPLLS